MSKCHPTPAPIDTTAKLSVAYGLLVVDPIEFRSLARWVLRYLTLTRLDLAYDIQQVCLYMHDLRESHLHFIKRILCYVKGTLDMSLHILAHSPLMSLTKYSDVD
jgi:hypothetical protein